MRGLQVLLLTVLVAVVVSFVPALTEAASSSDQPANSSTRGGDMNMQGGASSGQQSMDMDSKNSQSKQSEMSTRGATTQGEQKATETKKAKKKKHHKKKKTTEESEATRGGASSMNKGTQKSGGY